MPIERVDIPCNFVGSFKVGDNLVFNSRILCELAEANHEGVFNKPAIIQVGSILEAALAQIVYRAQNYNLEGVPNINEEDRQQIEGEKADKLYHVIRVLEKYGVLGELGDGIYDELHRLRKYRNKVHIQEPIKIPNTPADDDVAFSDTVYAWAIHLNHTVLAYLSDAFARPQHIHNYVAAIPVPRLQN